VLRAAAEVFGQRIIGDVIGQHSALDHVSGPSDRARSLPFNVVGAIAYISGPGVGLITRPKIIANARGFWMAAVRDQPHEGVDRKTGLHDARSATGTLIGETTAAGG